LYQTLLTQAVGGNENAPLRDPTTSARSIAAWAILGVIATLWMGPLPVARACRFGIATLVVLTFFGTIYLIYDGIAADRRVRELAVVLRKQIQAASTIEYNMRHSVEIAASGKGPFALEPFVKQIEDWRKQVSDWLGRELPRAELAVALLTVADGRHGPSVLEYTRIGILRSNLMAILDNLPSYVQRSR
jgi:hypothetical protein